MWPARLDPTPGGHPLRARFYALFTTAGSVACYTQGSGPRRQDHARLRALRGLANRPPVTSIAWPDASGSGSPYAVTPDKMEQTG